MRDWDARHLAAAAGASVVRPPSAAPMRSGERPNGRRQPGPVGVSIDSRALAPGELFVGLRGERTDGGEPAVICHMSCMVYVRRNKK